MHHSVAAGTNDLCFFDFPGCDCRKDGADQKVDGVTILLWLNRRKKGDAMSIRVVCQCGRELWAEDDEAGARGRCPSCNRKLIIPEAGELPMEQPLAGEMEAGKKADDSIVAAPMTPAAPAMPAVPEAVSRPRHLLYWVLALALIPVGWSALHPAKDDIEQRLVRTVAAHPQVLADLRHLSEEKGTLRDGDVLELLPGHRLEGSLLSRHTWWHWGFAGGSALLFLGMICCMASSKARPLDLLGVLLFTATIGMLFLFLVQWVADWTRGYLLVGGGVAAIAFYLAKFVAFSYDAAMGHTGLLLSLFGFTFGVGLCEEICKALPLWVYSNGEVVAGQLPSWRRLCVLGLASGVGFGVSEGILYAGRYYNGIYSGQVYLVRFISCVGLHAVWTAGVGMGMYHHARWARRREQMMESDGRNLRHAFLTALLPIMLLHGLYDTLLKKQMDRAALATAVASFLWMAWQIERARWAEAKQGLGATALAVEEAG
jgi:RsiW-degrading membrane proteinase PrsW (M82 family)